MRGLAQLLLCTLLLLAWPAAAVIETYEFSEPALEDRYQLLSAELRCPKCQNQNIADSNAPIAQDLRKLLHQQLEEGASDEEILEYMVARYGEFVRYRPRFSGATAMLWLTPIVLLLVGISIVLLTLRGRRRVTSPGTENLSARDQQRFEELLDESKTGEPRS